MNFPIYLFEDEFVGNFLPLVWMRPFVDLRVGISTLLEKWQKEPSHIKGLLVRDYIKDYTTYLYPGLDINVITEDVCFFLNARLKPYGNPQSIFNVSVGEGLKTSDGHIICFICEVDPVIENPDLNLLIKKVQVWHTYDEVEFLDDMSELVRLNGFYIKEDFKRFYPYFNLKIPPDLRATGEMLYIHEDADISPYVVIDASEGPVVIEKGAKIMPFVFIQGPAFIGENSVVKPFTKVFEGTTIGPVCKVGGEIEASIFHSYSNKQHDGFLGHSYVATWVNLGADTVTSDLKNNYSTVRLRYMGREWDTGMQFLGTFFSDHVKTGINTMLTSGTIVGVFSNVFGGGYMPKFIPSFSWGVGDSRSTYDPSKAIDTAVKMMARRNMKMSEVYKDLIFRVFEFTESERNFD